MVLLQELQLGVSLIHGILLLKDEHLNILLNISCRGRKRICIVFCFTLLTALSLRLINAYMLLFLSHVLSGLATALMYSVFESWYVSEHASRGFPAEWRARTFALATLLNSVVAILAGILANSLVDIWGFKAPYIASMLLVCFVATTVISTWTENYGSNQFVSFIGCRGGGGEIPLRFFFVNIVSRRKSISYKH